MGPNNAVRRRAARCRAAVLRRVGELPADMCVEAALRMERLEVRTFDPAARSGLGGFDALLDPFLPRVHVSAALAPPERTFALAHELGHHHLHRDAFLFDACENPAEVRAGVADTRVAGYSPLSLTEIQANAFADEFLCPAPWLRTRLAAGVAPPDVAREAGIPVETVRRQAVHALLPTPPLPRRRRRPRLDPEQEACASWHDGPLLVTGGPGTGKTTIVRERVRRLLAMKARPSSILVATATDGGAQSLHEDLARLDPRMVGHPWIMSVADVAFEVVIRWPDLVHRDENLRVLDRVATLGIVTRAIRNAGTQGMRPRQVLDDLRPRDGRRSPEAPEAARLVGDALIRAGAIDARGLVPLALDVLRASAVVKEDLRRRFEHLLVDDVQDLAPADLDLLRALCPVKPSVCLTGDPAQALEGYRGEAPCGVEGARRRFHPKERLLARNHRSRRIVADVLAALQGGDVATGRRRRGPARATLTTARDLEEEGRLIAARIADLRGRGVAYADQAVLAWSHDDLDAIASVLARAGVPVAHLGDVASRPEVAGALDFLRFAVDGVDDKFTSVAAMPPYRVHEVASRILAAKAGASRGRRRIAPLLAQAGEVPGIFKGAAARLRLLGAHVGLFERAGLADALIDWAFSADGHLSALLRGPATPTDQLGLVAVHHLLMTCREWQDQGGADAEGLASRLSSIGSRDQRTHFRRTRLHALGLDAVPLLTIPAARGLEFEATHLAALWRRDGKRDGARPAEEDGNVLGVGASRARGELHMTRPALRAGKPVRAMPGLDVVDRLLVSP